ncbi:leishmanolysin-related zinc metalloendopeptidase [Longimicrobium sp.]|uniref:leishmanolysin-related zinc metalloendopeptidase n=1 Tax=Longimicrobium sp. TaxID=2029185 RepID=UPI002E2FA261|nr:leishmanolysin-related zinc metalloendopeptidase [Longimicrobium sp.]HEX6039638.1 leishmanolysin-related zinc metalloendopeptidase [Longimicrobium sp.]
MRLLFRSCAAALVLGTMACADDAARPTLPPDPAPTPVSLGVAEVTITGLGTSEVRSSIRPVDGASGPSTALNPVSTIPVLEFVSSGTFVDGVRGAGGQRYVTASYRVRNNAGRSLSNLTWLLVGRSNAIPGSPFSSLLRFDGTAADPAIAGTIAPTGAVAPRSDLDGLRSLQPDVLQVFTEAEVAAITRPAGVLEVFPSGFVVRNASTEATSRTLPAATSVNQFDGVVTFSFRVPLQATSSADVFSVSFQVLAIEDTETRMTESIEEGQDTTAVRLLRERAASLGATTVTVLAGSPASGPEVADYPGQRQICSVRTAGTAAAPTGFITRPAGYALLALFRPGESVSACGANFRSGTASAPALNTAYPITLRAMDRYGNVITGAVDTVALSRVSGPAATFGATASLASGQATVNVTFQAAGTSALAARGRRNRGQRTLVVPATATIALNGGTNQIAMAGTAVPVAPSVVVRDLGGAALAGVPVTFTVTGGGGSVTSTVVSTNASGVASAGGWTMGSSAALNTLTATTPRASTSVGFEAGGCAGGGGTGYAITLCYLTPLSTPQRAAFENAAARWSTVITGDLPGGQFSAAANACEAGSPSMNLVLDDLVIVVRVENIDGVSGILGSASPCFIRNPGNQPLLGTMRFDAADMEEMESEGLLENVIRHEMGHVLGIGSLWSFRGFLANPSPVGGPVLDTYYTGSNGIAGFNLIGGNTYTGGQKVPVENDAPAGTINVHWRESVLANELMTGYANTGSMPLSQLTARSLVDMGYTVNTSSADPFFLTLALRADPEELVPLVNDVDFGPLYRVDQNGRTTRIR